MVVTPPRMAERVSLSSSWPKGTARPRWVWGSMIPGSTYRPEASMTRRPRGTSAVRAAIFPPRTHTFSGRQPISGSTQVPPRMTRSYSSPPPPAAWGRRGAAGAGRDTEAGCGAAGAGRGAGCGAAAVRAAAWAASTSFTPRRWASSRARSVSRSSGPITSSVSPRRTRARTSSEVRIRFISRPPARF